jgi:hypothetical protein
LKKTKLRTTLFDSYQNTIREKSITNKLSVQALNYRIFKKKVLEIANESPSLCEPNKNYILTVEGFAPMFHLLAQQLLRLKFKTLCFSG